MAAPDIVSVSLFLSTGEPPCATWLCGASGLDSR